MVIQKFNKLIRNKWVWSVFAIIVSAAFCFDGSLFSSSDDVGADVGAAGKLGSESVDAALFTAIADDVRGIGPRRDWRRSQADVNRESWETYAALEVADKNGITATADEIKSMILRDPGFQEGGAFNFARYQEVLRQNSLTPERYESMLVRNATMMRLSQAALSSAVWASPAEIDRAVYDMTDVFTVRVARFSQSKKDADKVKLDDAGLRKWYDANVASLALPERVKIRYIRFDATKKDILDRMVVTEDEMRDRYDVTINRYTTTDTNGVEKVKKFEDVKAGIEKELRQIAAVQYYETNLNFRVYSKKAAKGASRLDEIAKEEKMTVHTSPWFATDGSFHEGFTARYSTFVPGARDFAAAVAELDAESEDLRYGVVVSDRAVWLIEKCETSAAHTPSFEEARSAIRPRALTDAKADAFKKAVEAVIAKGYKAVAAQKSVSTNITFTVSDAKYGQFFDQMEIMRAAMKLKKGEVSGFTLTSPGNALVVLCEDRKEGDAAKVIAIRSQVREEVLMLQRRQIPERWRKWNLERIGFEPGPVSSVEEVEIEE
jgi:hypothetical protein